MQELTDDQLDGLFRKSAEEFNPPQDPAAWQAMSRLLDTHNQTVPAPKPSFWKKNTALGLSVLLLLLLSIGGWLTYRQLRSANRNNVTSQNQPTNQSRIITPNRTDRSTTPANEQIEANHSVEPKKVETDRPTSTETKNLESAGKTAHSVPVQTDGQLKQSTVDDSQLLSEAIIPRSAENLEKVTLTKKRVGTNSRLTRTKSMGKKSTKATRHEAGSQSLTTTHSPLKNDLITNRSARSGRSRLRATDRARVSSANQYAIKQRTAFTNSPFIDKPINSGTTQTVEPTPDKSIEPVVLLATTEMASRSGQWPKPLVFKSRELTLPDTGEAAFVKKPSVLSQSRQTGLSIRFVVAPDLSTIGLKDFQRPGTNVGMMVEYRLAPRWSVQTGALRSTKIYRTNKIPDYTQKFPVPPESVSGQCRIIDIPLNLRYDVALRLDPNGQVRGRWFVGGGLTSYIMQQEDYTYNYADPTNSHNYPDKYPERQGWHGRTGWYGFSQLNISGGYERRLNRRLSWQVEPFIKAPLKGVGYYKINLLSTGVFFSLRYKF